MPASRVSHYLPALLSGLLLFLAAPGRLEIAPLAWLALVPLLWSCRSASPRQAFRLGLAGGFFYYLLLLYWIVIVLSTYGNLPWYVAGLALILLALYMSLYLAVFAAGFSWLAPRVSSLWAAPVLWVALDFLRARLFTGFPWQDLAYSQYKIPLLIQSADIFGHAGITFLIVLANILVVTLAAKGVRRGRLRPASPVAASAAAILLLAHVGYGGYRLLQVPGVIQQAESWPVTLVQGNIPQDQKWTPSFQERTIEIYLDLSRKAMAEKSAKLLIWPETALPFYPLETPRFQELISQLADPTPVNLLTGAPHRERIGNELRYFNSALLVSGPGRITGIYAKQHLVPFGEYVPLRRLLPFTTPLVETLGDFTPGPSGNPISSEGVGIGVLICFESIFPELARKQTAQGARLLINITNDAWFGSSSAPHQHLSMAVFRAVENRRALARAANTGISGFADPMGRLSATTDLFKPAYLTGQVPLLSGKTFYVRYGYHFPLVCLILLLPLFLAAALRPARPEEHP